MSLQRAQLAALVGTSLRMDLRSRGTFRARGGVIAPIVWTFLFYAAIGLSTGIGLVASQSAPFVFATVSFAVAGTMVFFNIMIEYQEVLMAPADGDVLFWRPIDSRTLFVAKVLHMLAYVALVTVPLLLGPSILILGVAKANSAALLSAFWIGGYLNNLAATALTLVVYGVMLRRISAERFQDLLAWVQLVFSIVVMIAMQLMSTLLERLGTVEDPRVLVSLRFVPSAWFASLPNLVANGAEPAMLGLFALGLLVLAITGAYALQRLAPVYEEAIARVGAVSAPAEKPESRSRRLQDLFARVVVRHPMACTGFEFFLANLRGDRRVKIALLPNVGLPLALLLYAFATGETRDPYARDTRPQTSIAAPAPGPEGPAEHTATHRSARPDRLYAPVYVLALLGAAMSRMISTSASWKAAWIFHIAPLRRFDRFYSGVLWGVVYGLMLPAVILLGLSLLLAWHDPLHVSAHLALPFGLALLVFAFSSSIDPAPPFSRESRPHARTGEIVLSMLLAIPTVIVGIVHYRMRQHPLQLVLVGALMIGVALCAWMLAGRRIRNAIGKHPFEG